MANKENSVSKELLLEFLNHALSLQEKIMENPDSVEHQNRCEAKILTYESLINMVSVGTFDTL
tara:strand:- start:5528 stop:5716 length:189 start_codon:yes stop_codon:yes gene_type:complete